MLSPTRCFAPKALDAPKSPGAPEVPPPAPGAPGAGILPGVVDSLDIPATDAVSKALRIRRVGANIYCGPRPDAIMLDHLKTLGIKTIVNLEDYHTYWGWFGWRTRTLAERAGMHMVRQPMSPIFWVGKNRIREIIDVLGDPSRGPSYVHCLFGKERTNLVVALHRRLNESVPENLVRRAMYRDGFRALLVPLLAVQVYLGLLACRVPASPTPLW